MHLAELTVIIVLTYLLASSIARVYQVIEIIKVDITYEDGEVVSNSKAWMNKLSRTVSAPNLEIVLSKDIHSVPTIVELFRIFGAQSVPLPFNISGDGCKLLATDYLIVPDLKASGNLGNCPVKKGPIYLHNVLVHPENWPPIPIEGIFSLKFSFFNEGKKILVIDGGLRISRSKTPQTFADIYKLNKTTTDKS